MSKYSKHICDCCGYEHFINGVFRLPFIRDGKWAETGDCPICHSNYIVNIDEEGRY